MTLEEGEATMASEIRIRLFMSCLDTEGRRIKIGAGATEGGRVAILIPPGSVPVLSADEISKYLELIRQALIEASRQHL